MADSYPADLLYRKEPVCPFELKRLLWPDIIFYNKQKAIIRSVQDNDETMVVAGNMLGKDYICGFIALWFFLSRDPVHVVTTSVDFDQLRNVLWGEINSFIQHSKYPLTREKGGPLVVNFLHVRKFIHGAICPKSYLIGRTCERPAGMLGHHLDRTDGIPRCLYIADECSAIRDEIDDAADRWAHRKLLVGNPFLCNNFFFRGIKGGDVVAA